MTNSGSGAVCTRLKCSIARALMNGENPKASPATHAAAVSPVMRRAHANIASAETTPLAITSTLNVATIPSSGSSGNASTFATVV